MASASSSKSGAPGRPAVGVRVPVRLGPELLDEIDRRARLLGRSRAALIRSLLAEALGQGQAPDDGVDRTQIRRQLALEPGERIRYMAGVAAQQQRIRARARPRTRS